MKLTVVDLFAGCGGLSLGLINAGFDVVAGIDNWEPTIAIYKKNFSHPSLNVDLSEKKNFKMIADFKADVIVGGPPCQDFSSAGKRDETGTRGDLTISFAEIIKKARPRYFLMENVDRITKTTRLTQTIALFKRAGYGLSYKVLDASYCGVPQARKRFILFGELNGSDGALDQYFEKKLRKTPMTIREYLGDSLGVEHYYRHPRNYSRRGVFSIDEPSPTIRGVNRPVPSGYAGHPNDSVSVRTDVRPLTSHERALIQTFPESFIWVGKKTELEQIIGNAVPVKLAEYVGNCIAEYIRDKKLGIRSSVNLFEYV